MARFSNQLTFARVPFCLDAAKVFRMTAARPDYEAQEDTALVFPPDKHQPQADLIDEIDRLLPFKYSEEMGRLGAYAGRNLGALARSLEEKVAPDNTIRIGEFYYPTGASRYGIFRGLATSTQVKQMLAATRGLVPGLFVMRAVSVGAANLPATLQQYTIETPMFLLPPKPLGEIAGRFDGLYAVTLVDERYYLAGSPVYLHPQQGTTWADLIQQLALAMGITISLASAINPAYTAPELDSQLWCNLENATVLLDAVAANIGRTVVRNLIGTYSLLTPFESVVVATTNRPIPQQVVRIAGGDFFNPPTTRLPVGSLTQARNAVLPSEVLVTFPKYVVGDDPVPHFINQRYQPQRRSTWYEESHGDVFTFSVPVQSGGFLVSGMSGIGQHYVHTTAKALYSGDVAISGEPLNYSGLVAMSVELARDRYYNLAAVGLDEAYPGTYGWTPEGIHDIVWTYSARMRQASTRVVRQSWTRTVDEFQHATPNASGGTSNPRGVGGPSVPQTIRDSYQQSGTFVGGSGMSGGIQTRITHPVFSGDSSVLLEYPGFLPTQNRWKAEIVGSGFASGGNILLGNPLREILFVNGTSGGIQTTRTISGVVCSGFLLSVVYRAIDGTVQPIIIGSGAVLRQGASDTTYGVNLTTHEKMQFAYPNEWTSGGIQGVNVVPQTQTVSVLSASGIFFNNILHYSGLLRPFDGVYTSGPWMSGEYVWIIDRNGAAQVNSGLLLSGPLSGGTISGSTYSGTAYSGMTFSGQNFSGYAESGTGNVSLISGKYDGQLVGYAGFLSGQMKPAPIYSINQSPATMVTQAAGTNNFNLVETSGFDHFGTRTSGTILYFEQGRGFDLASQSGFGAYLLINFADPVTPGVVSITGQSFLGTKTFVGQHNLTSGGGDVVNPPIVADRATSGSIAGGSVGQIGSYGTVRGDLYVHDRRANTLGGGPADYGEGDLEPSIIFSIRTPLDESNTYARLRLNHPEFIMEHVGTPTGSGLGTYTAEQAMICNDGFFLIQRYLQNVGGATFGQIPYAVRGLSGDVMLGTRYAVDVLVSGGTTRSLYFEGGILVSGA